MTGIKGPAKYAWVHRDEEENCGFVTKFLAR